MQARVAEVRETPRPQESCAPAAPQTVFVKSGTNRHTHPISDITGLEGALDNKADEDHTHDIVDVNGLQEELDSKIPLTQKAQPGGVATLGPDGKVPPEQIPPTTGAEGGTVTSVGLALPPIFNVTGSPVTEAGVLTGQLVSQPPNRLFAGPASGANAVPAFRSVVPHDLGAGTADATTWLRGDQKWEALPAVVIPPLVWGAITGTLPNQIDLQTALNGKSNVGHTHAVSDITGLQSGLDGKVAKAGDTMTGNLAIAPPSGGADIGLSVVAAQSAGVTFKRAGSLRWSYAMNGQGETGANAGSNFGISRFTDAGAFIDNPIGINRATGIVTFTAAPKVGAAALATLPIAQSDVTNLVTDLAGKAPTVHVHSTADITSGIFPHVRLGTGGGSNVKFLREDGVYATPATESGAVAWGAITGTLSAQTDLQTALDGKAPTVHTHTTSQITGLDTALAGKANTVHAHVIADTTGLQAALDGKAPTVHTHTTADITGLDTALAGKAATVHVHSGADITTGTVNFARLGTGGGTAVKYLREDNTWQLPPAPAATAWGSITGTLSAQTDLQTALNGKAPTVHSHATSDITGLDTTLAGKAPLVHTHAIADVTDLQTTLDSKVPLTQKAAAGGVATLDAGVKVPIAQIPALPYGTGDVTAPVAFPAVNALVLANAADKTVRGSAFWTEAPATGQITVTATQAATMMVINNLDAGGAGLKATGQIFGINAITTSATGVGCLNRATAGGIAMQAETTGIPIRIKVGTITTDVKSAAAVSCTWTHPAEATVTSTYATREWVATQIPVADPNVVTAAAAFAADNRLLRSDGTAKGAQASGWTLADTGELSFFSSTASQINVQVSSNGTGGVGIQGGADGAGGTGVRGVANGSTGIALHGQGWSAGTILLRLTNFNAFNVDVTSAATVNRAWQVPDDAAAPNIFASRGWSSSTFAAVSHTHTTSQITGLDTALAGKAPTVHTHTTADVTGLDTALAGKAPTVHTHTTADVTGLDTALAGKAPLASPAFTGIVTSSDTTNSTSKDTGGVVIEGGLGVEKNIFAGGLVNTPQVQAGRADIGGSTSNSASLNVSGWNGSFGNIHMRPIDGTGNDASGITFYTRATGADSTSRQFMLGCNWVSSGGFDINQSLTSTGGFSATRFNINMNGVVNIPSVIASTGKTTGGLVVSGGLGVGGAINAGGAITGNTLRVQGVENANGLGAGTITAPAVAAQINVVAGTLVVSKGHWMRVGNIVTYASRFTCQLSTNGAASFTITPPVLADFADGDTDDAIGICVGAAGPRSRGVVSASPDGKLSVQLFANTTVSQKWTFYVTYKALDVVINPL